MEKLINQIYLIMGSKKNKTTKNTTKKTEPIEQRNYLEYLPKPLGLNSKQVEFLKGILEKDITIGIGASGTGKTYSALLQAFNILKNSDKIDKIVLVKSVTVVKGEEIGFLKGTQEEKMEPFMYSYSGNINKIFKDESAAKKLLETKIVQWLPLSYIRGVNIDNAVIIVDESQNLTVDLFKTIITRLGFNSKIIFLGDTEQIDRHNKKESCLTDICDIFKDNDLVNIVKFNDDECIRNPIIPKILTVLNEYENVINYAK